MKRKSSESYLQQAIAIYRKAQLLEHPDLAQILTTYTSFLFVLNRKAESEEAKARAKAIRAKHTND